MPNSKNYSFSQDMDYSSSHLCFLGYRLRSLCVACDFTRYFEIHRYVARAISAIKDSAA
ncbi:unnamed protein product [Acidithrix sp. C25]|nr:unnamed protein product [Acidithrix sp. C25]